MSQGRDDKGKPEREGQREGCIKEWGKVQNKGWWSHSRAASRKGCKGLAGESSKKGNIWWVWGSLWQNQEMTSVGHHLFISRTKLWYKPFSCLGICFLCLDSANADVYGFRSLFTLTWKHVIQNVKGQSEISSPRTEYQNEICFVDLKFIVWYCWSQFTVKAEWWFWWPSVQTVYADTLKLKKRCSFTGAIGYRNIRSFSFQISFGQPLDLGFGKGVDMNGLHCIVLGSQDAGSENKVRSFS